MLLLAYILYHGGQFLLAGDVNVSEKKVISLGRVRIKNSLNDGLKEQTVSAFNKFNWNS